MCIKCYTLQRCAPERGGVRRRSDGGMAEDLPPLEVVLECIPAANRRLLDEKPNRKSRAIIAKSIRNWKTLAQYFPNIETDIEAIEYNNPHNLNLQR